MEYEDIYIGSNLEIPEELKDYNLDVKKVPYLIHGGLVICEIFPILKYCCLKFNRPDLLGRTIEDSIRIAEIFVKYHSEKNRLLNALMMGIKEIQAKNLGEQGLELMRQKLLEVNETNKFFQATKKMFMKTSSYLCGYLTVLDFLFYEVCFNFVHLCNLTNPESHPCVVYKNEF